MADAIENSKELQLFMFIEQMNDRYLSPLEIEFRINPEFKNDKLLELILAIRKKKSELLYLLHDQQNRSFHFWKTPRMEKMLHEIDIQRSRWQEAQPAVLKELLIRSLIDEAFYSSWIEGAKTTRRRAEELVRQNQTPQDRSERMCLNNFRTMEFILKNLNRKLDEEFLCEIHKIATENTLDPQDEPFSGKYRNEQNYVVDEPNQRVDYTPPPASDVPALMQKLYDWVNLEGMDSLFLHPVIKASIIHFYLVYVHPFFDGNGRTARALMYHYLLKHGYDFMKFFSISKAIAGKRKNYYQAILNVEKYDSDLTYFLLFSIQMVLDALTTVETEKNTEQTLAEWLAQLHSTGLSLSPRQEKIFKIHFREKIFPITIKKYQKITRVVYQTARTDLTDLCTKGLLKMKKKGREFVYDRVYLIY